MTEEIRGFSGENGFQNEQEKSSVFNFIIPLEIATSGPGLAGFRLGSNEKGVTTYLIYRGVLKNPNNELKWL